jgi:hypothetical protein
MQITMPFLFKILEYLYTLLNFALYNAIMKGICGLISHLFIYLEDSPKLVYR